MKRLLQKIVRNEAMKQDPPEIYGWRIYALALSACFGGMVFGMDTGTIGGVLVLPEFEKKYGIDQLSKTQVADLSANIVSTLQAGCFVGALAAAPIADRWGRKPALIAAAVVVFLGVVMQASADGYLAPMYVGRFVAGLGTGAASMVNPLYVSENSPRAIRGGLTGLYQLFIVFGIMLSFWCNYGSLQNLTGAATYVVPLSLQAMPAILLFIFMLMCAESPRFLAKQDRWEESKAVLARLRNLSERHEYVETEFSEIRGAIDHERMLVGGSSWLSLQKEMWLIPSNRKRALISVMLMICQQFTGTNAINYYAPQIFRNIGITGSSTGLFATGIYGVVKLVAIATFLIFVADSLGRRRSLLWTSIAQGLCMLYIGLYIRISPPQPDKAVSGAGYFALVCIFLFAIFYQFGWGPVPWILVSEISTARLRALNVSLAAATQWLFNFVVSRAVPSMLANMGSHGFGTYIFFAAFCFSFFFFTWFLVPETKGLSLEDMGKLFGQEQVPGKHDLEAGDSGSMDGEAARPEKRVERGCTQHDEEAVVRAR